MTRWQVLRVFGLIAALILMGVLIARLGPDEIANRVVQAGPGVIWLLVVYAAGTTVAALPWHVLLPKPTRPPASASIASRFAASGANAILPLFGFGGEAVRLLWMRPPTRAAGVAAIIVDRLIYGVASAVLLLAGVIAVVQMISFPTSYTIAAAIGVGALVVIIAVGVVLATRCQVAARIHRLIRRMRRQAATTDVNFGEDVDRNIELMFRLRERQPWVALLLHVIGRALIGAEWYVGFLILGVSLSWDQALVFASVPILLSFVGAVVPSQLGVQEGAQALIATSLGLSPTIAVAVVLLSRMRAIASGTIAWLLVARRKSESSRHDESWRSNKASTVVEPDRRVIRADL